MTDLSQTIIAKSDQLNADDLIGRTIDITITGVKSGGADQPIAISYEGDKNKPYMPCKNMRRVLVHCWGADGKAYAGRSLRLFRDPEVKFGGMAVGGIRISHMSHIDSAITMALTASKANKKPYTVKPLTGAPTPKADNTPPAPSTAPTTPPDPAAARIKQMAEDIRGFMNEAEDATSLTGVTEKYEQQLAEIKEYNIKTYDFLIAAYNKKLASFE